MEGRHGDSSGLREQVDHPRRSLSERQRAQADKFLQLAARDPDRSATTLEWAEQAARQAILHDFTNERAWKTLLSVISCEGDTEKVRVLLEDLFTVLGRDPDSLAALNMTQLGPTSAPLVDAALERDPLDADMWWAAMARSGDVDARLGRFERRCLLLDLRDQRANILYARRLERVRRSGRAELYERLANHLLAHRPTNFELWVDLARHHERMQSWDHAWLAWDQATALRPEREYLIAFRNRLVRGLGENTPAPPTDSARIAYLERLERLASSISIKEKPLIEVANKHPEKQEKRPSAEIEALLASGRPEHAFLMARRLFAAGNSWAEEWVQKARIQIGEDELQCG